MDAKRGGNARPIHPRTLARSRLAIICCVSPLAVSMVPATAHAQIAPNSLVSACSGVSLPRSVVTDILRPVITGVASPLEDRVNDILGIVDIIPLVGSILPRLNLDATGLLNQASTGEVTLGVLASDGTVVGAGAPCNSSADSFTLTSPAGLAIGGNQITGLGGGGALASAGEVNSIAFGNGATTAGAATGAIAIGANASVTAANSVALGTGSAAMRGAVPSYAAFGLAAPQASAGEVSVGAAGAERQITNVAAGSAPTDAVNVAQLQGVAAQVGALSGAALTYDDPATRRVATLAGAGGTRLANVAPGAVTAASTDAVNGAQLFATETRVTDLTSGINNGGVGVVRYSNAATPAVPNGGVPTNEAVLVGAAAGAVGLHNVRDGLVAAGSTDAVTGSQLFAVSADLDTIEALAVRYDDGTRAEITLGGAGAPGVTVQNVAPGTLATTSTAAVNGAQLFATNNQVATNTTAITNLAATINNGSLGALRYSDPAAPAVPNAGTPTNDVALVGAAAGPVGVHNVRDGVVAAGSADAVTGGQLFATNNQVATNTTAITNLTTTINNGSLGAVRYSDAATPTVPNGGSPTNDVVLVGAAAGPVGVHNVRDGLVAAGSTDAVTGGQLFAVSAALGTVEALAVRYDDPTRAAITLGGAGTPAVAVQNVAAGALAAGSTDAVNGAQLFATNTQLATNTTAITNLATTINSGSVGALRYSDPGSPTVPNGGTPTNDVALVGAGPGSVGVHNVAAGAVTAGGTDAVNGGQVFALGSSVASSLGGASSFDPANATVDFDVTFNGIRHASLQSALNAVGGAIGGMSPVLSYLAVNSTRPAPLATGEDSVAVGPDASASAANSVALGTGSVAARGGQANYAALGVAGPQSSAGEVSVGGAGAERQITNVAAGSAPTDAVNVAQLQGVSDRVEALAATGVGYDDPSRATVTLAGAGGTRITNVAAGDVSATSTDAVNGAQLAATNGQVASNSSAITNLTMSISNGSVGAVQYSNPGSPTTPNGGVVTNDVALVGAGPGPVGLHNVAAGRIAAGSTDAVTGGQVYELALGATNGVQYDRDAAGNRANAVTLAGGDPAAQVTIRNLAAGNVAAGSTEAVNGGQLAATEARVAAAQGTAGQALGLAQQAQTVAATASDMAEDALAMGQNSVQYSNAARTSVVLGSVTGGPVTLGNVANGVEAMDAANIGQLNAGLNNAVARSMSYTDARFAEMSFDLKSTRRSANAGTAGALAAAALPQAFDSSANGMLSLGVGTYQGEQAVAVGFSKAFGRTVMKMGAAYDSRGKAGANAGVGIQF